MIGDEHSAIVSCPLCALRMEPADPMRAALFRCRRCGLVSHERTATSREEELLYLRPPGNLDRNMTAALHQWKWFTWLGPPLPGRLLDAGCGAGAFLEVASSQGWRAQGIEINPELAARARCHGVPVDVGSIMDAEITPGLDAITMWDVLDHLSKPAEALTRIRSWLRPGGILVVRVRNVNWHLRMRSTELKLQQFLGRTRGLTGNSYFVTHRYGFTVNALLSLLERCRFGEPRIMAGAIQVEFAQRPRLLSHVLRRYAAAVSRAVWQWSGGRCYWSPSILIAARRT